VISEVSGPRVPVLSEQRRLEATIDKEIVSANTNVMDEAFARFSLTCFSPPVCKLRQ
jgi:hypothetical protein